MNILIIGTFENESFASHISENLNHMGHYVKIFDIMPLRINNKNKYLYRLNQLLQKILSIFSTISLNNKRGSKIFKILNKNKLELIIVTHDFLTPNEVDLIKNSANVKIVMWFPDHIANFGKAYFMNSNYDFLFFKDPYIVITLSKILKSKIYYLPECFNEFKHKNTAFKIQNKYICDITTAGNFHSWRVAFFEHLKDFNIKFWGSPPPVWMPVKVLNRFYQGRSVFNSEKAQAFLGAKIVLNNLHFAEVLSLNVRAFEAAGIGAFQLIDWRPEIDHLFIDGKEIITYKNIHDLKSKITYWLLNPDKRNVIANAGKLRAMKEHTYKHRLNLLIKTVEGIEEGFKMPDYNNSTLLNDEN